MRFFFYVFYFQETVLHIFFFAFYIDLKLPYNIVRQ